MGGVGLTRFRRRLVQWFLASNWLLLRFRLWILGLWGLYRLDSALVGASGEDRRP